MMDEYQKLEVMNFRLVFWTVYCHVSLINLNLHTTFIQIRKSCIIQ